MIELHGQQFIGSQNSAQNPVTFQSINPASNEALPTHFHEASTDEIDQALQLASAAFDEFRHTSAEQRAVFLETIVAEVEALGDQFVEQAQAETGLPRPRCEGERGRAIGQARQFAELLRDGSWVDARIDLPQPDRQPLPKPDVRSMMLPIGPVVVFGASNFPIAISVLGADTVSALASGCPVIVKAHPAHPATCELATRAVLAAVKKCGLPEGTFSLIHGRSHDTGMALVKHPQTQAVAFTGSLAGGRALCDAAAARPHPIPVYAEMGSVNPIFLLPGALKERAAQIGSDFIQSVTLGVGQFCTCPGLVFAVDSDDLGTFTASAAESAKQAPPATMLHPGIHEAFWKGVNAIDHIDGFSLIGQSGEKASAEKNQAACSIFETDSATLRDHPQLYDEVFGPVSTVSKCQSVDELEHFADQLEGSLTASIHGTDEDLAEHAGLIRILETKVGRLIFNGYPTGIEVCHAMHHGGPYPASSHSHFTSIGTRCIYRFVRPVCYQGWPQQALPAELKNDNPAQIWRLLDGEVSQAAAE
ncbi:MAG: aldehyde dehydrogenase (NADP(+)) [Verrucomicrobiota bacterium]